MGGQDRLVWHNTHKHTHTRECSGFSLCDNKHPSALDGNAAPEVSLTFLTSKMSFQGSIGKHTDTYHINQHI